MSEPVVRLTASRKVEWWALGFGNVHVRCLWDGCETPEFDARAPKSNQKDLGSSARAHDRMHQAMKEFLNA